MKSFAQNDNYNWWLNKLCALNVAKTPARGLAPHKPILLLCLIDMIEDRSLTTTWVEFSPELFFRFQCYWEIVLDRQRNKPDMRMPFHALGGVRDKVWTCYQEDRKPSPSKVTTRLCNIDSTLWECMQQAEFRNNARLRLISRYFTAPEQVALCSRLNLPIPSSNEIELFRKCGADYKVSVKKGRDSRFRNDVLLNYRFTCALTGYSLNTSNENIVEAAHIHQHADSGNNDIRNGLALTPDAHWMFDRGLWTAVEKKSDFVVIVAKKHFVESSPLGRTLLYHHERPLIFHFESILRPHAKYLEWHQTHRFRG